MSYPDEWNHKMSKNKTTQAYRRQLRNEIKNRMVALESILKPRPWWFPQYLWSRIASIIIDVNKIAHPFQK